MLLQVMDSHLLHIVMFFKYNNNAQLALCYILTMQWQTKLPPFITQVIISCGGNGVWIR